MSVFRRLASFAVIVSVFVLLGVWLESESRLHAQDSAATSLVGAWTLNRDLSDNADEQSAERRGDGDTRGRRRGGGGGRGAGFGGGFGRGGSSGAVDREETARQRDALRDILNPPDHLTIVQTDSLIIMTGPDGRTTRLSPDGKKVKDDSTKIERKTKWDGGKLVSEISGLGGNTITETFAVDPERHQLRIVGLLERAGRKTTTAHVYDADSAGR